MTYWILIADASRARIYSTARPDEPLKLERQLENPSGRARTQELVTDSPGRAFKGSAPGTRSAMEPRTTAHEAAAEHFAGHLGEMLGKELNAGAFDSLAIIAPPHLLGQIRSHLPKKVEHHVRATVARDLVGVAETELRPYLDTVFEHRPD